MKSTRVLTRPPVAAVIAALWIAVALGFGHWNPEAFAVGYRFAFFCALAPALGSLIFTLIHRSAGGEWGMSLHGLLAPGVDVAPWIWLCGLPLILVPGGFHATPSGYESLPWIAIRSLAVAALLFVLRRLLQTSAPGGLIARDNERSWIGPVGLILTVFALTFVADDWIEGAHPGWHSTAFPIVWMASQCAAGLALVILLGLNAGIRPDEKRQFSRPLGNDWGNLLLATLIFWTYVSYGEFIIVWSGNKPDEISWFLTREQSGWFYVIPALFICNFLVPFLLLLSRRFKTNARGLSGLCMGILACQVLYVAWLTLPESPRGGAGVLLIDALLAFLAIGLVAFGYGRSLRKQDAFR